MDGGAAGTVHRIVRRRQVEERARVDGERLGRVQGNQHPAACSKNQSTGGAPDVDVSTTSKRRLGLSHTRLDCFTPIEFELKSRVAAIAGLVNPSTEAGADHRENRCRTRG